MFPQNALFRPLLQLRFCSIRGDSFTLLSHAANLQLPSRLYTANLRAASSQATHSRPKARTAILPIESTGGYSAAAQKAYHQKLASEGVTLPLYRPRPTVGYYTGIYALTAFLFGCGWLTSQLYYDDTLESRGRDRQKVWWEYPVRAVPIVFFAGMGTWVFLKTTNVIIRMDAVPSSKGMMVHAYTRPLLPLPKRRGKLIEVQPRDIHIGCPEPRVMPVETHSSNPTSAQRVGRVWQDLFAGTKKIFHNDFVAGVHVRDLQPRFKIDSSGYFATDRKLLTSMLVFDR